MLASVMRRFGDGDIDVLLCTTIIELGLDIPNANTIVIDDAHRLGLAQLYQLRGRVGRAGQRAYAYMMYPPARSLTEKADKRLDVIGDLQDLGAGFKLAMRDLEIRGAGNLLGEEQHGEIAAVGLELYNHLLADAVTIAAGQAGRRVARAGHGDAAGGCVPPRPTTSATSGCVFAATRSLPRA